MEKVFFVAKSLKCATLSAEFMDNSSQPIASPYAREKKPFPRKLVFLLLLFLLLTAGGIAGVRYFATQNNAGSLVSPQTSPSPIASPTPSLIPTPTEEAAATTPQPTGKVSPTKTTGTTTSSTRSNTTVSILNGSGVVGAAAKVSTTLKDLGYQIGVVGNASTFDYEDVSIQVKKGKTSLLSQLKQDLKEYTIGSTSATLAESNAADAVVIVGK